MKGAWSLRGESVKDGDELHREAGEEGGRRPFSVGPWRVEPALNRLECRGQTLRVEPKVMDVLVVLASRAPEVVSREELQETVWGTAYVSEDLPRRAVYALRKAFQDDPRRPEYIETIPRSGYRLVAPVVPVAVTEPATESGARPTAAGAAAALGRARPALRPPSPSAPGPPARPPLPRRWRRLAPAAGLLAAGLLAAAALSLGLLRSDLRKRTPGLEISPLTTRPGLEYDPAFSPDGSRVAFLRAPDSSEEATISLHVQLVGVETSLELGDPPLVDRPIESPTWSPGGTAIAYRRWQEPGGWAIYRIPSLGGSERKLVDLGRIETSGLSWSPDGRWLALGLRPDPDGPLALYRIGVETLERQRLTDPPATILGDKLPAWSPDGRFLAFVRNLAGEASELRVVPAAGGTSRPLLPEHHKIADVDWSPDGRRLLVAVHHGGRHRIWSVDPATGAVRPLDELGDDTRWVTVPRQGDRLAIGRARWELGIRRYDLASGEATPLPGLSSTFYDEALDLSPGGDRLAMVSTRSGSPEVWISDLEGRRPVQITSFGGPIVGHPRWLPGGEALVFHADVEGRFDLWTVADEGTPPRRLTGPPGEHRVPSVARDGTALYFASDRSGQWQVWRMAPAGGPATQVTRQGGYFAQESPDGSWIYYTRWQRHGLWRVPRGGGEEEQVLGDELAAWEWGNWAVTREGLYFVTRGGDTGDGQTGVDLVLYAPESGKVLRRIPLAGTPVQPGLSLFPTGDAALLAEVDRIQSDLVLVEGLGGGGY